MEENKEEIVEEKQVEEVKEEKTEVKEPKKGGSGIFFIFIILIALGVLGFLIGSGKISLTKDKTEEVKEQQKAKEDNKVSREEVVKKLKEKLTNEDWIEANLYAKKDCFDDDVTIAMQNLKFMMEEDENGLPMVLVENETGEAKVLICYKVYYDNGEIKVKSVTDFVGNPNHGVFLVDKKQGVVAYQMLHNGDFSFTAYNVLKNDITVYDEYSCEDCNSYRGDKEYELSGFSNKLNNDNVNVYVK